MVKSTFTGTIMEFIRNLPDFIKNAYANFSDRGKGIAIMVFFAVLLYLVSMPSTSVLYTIPVLGAIFTSTNLFIVSLMCVILAHMLRKVFFNYDKDMFLKLYIKASETANGAGLFALAMSICFLGITFLIMAAARV